MELILSKALAWFVASLSAEARQPVYDALGREALAIQALPAGSDRARAVHRQVEAAAARFQALKPELVAGVRCGQGCSHCCRIQVELTLDEAALLAERVRAGSAQPDPERLQLQRTWASPAAFVGRPRREADCVLLGADGACTVYEDRPSACRALLVASDPDFCRDAQAATQVLAVINPYLELVVSAAQTVNHAAGARHTWMAAGLAEALEDPRRPLRS